MNLVIWLIVGGAIGWLASKIMNIEAQGAVFLNVLVGVIGAPFSGWLLSPLVETSLVDQRDFSPSGLLVSLTGAAVLLILVNVVRKATDR